MIIAIIDADLIGRKKHRFPNLVCMKLSGYHKRLGDEVIFKTDYGEVYDDKGKVISYDGLKPFDIVYISKVFTDTPIDPKILELPNVEYGGTGFYFDKAPNLPYEVEHSFPDYHLYDNFIQEKINQGAKRNEFKEYLDYSIGYVTRGCFRRCDFCVNQKYDHVFKASPLDEFYDPDRPKICLLDDNFLGFPQWREILEELQATGKPFKFKQGLDERLLTPLKCELLFSSKYDGSITFAFDRIEDRLVIEDKIKLIRKYTKKQCTFYVLVGFDPSGRYDNSFWLKDIEDMFKRIEILGSYGMVPYIMRYEKYNESPFRGVYITVARWVNQFSYFKKESLWDYVFITDYNSGGRASGKYFTDFDNEHTEIADKYFYNRYWRPG